MGIALSVIPMLIHILALNYLWMEKSYKLWNVKSNSIRIQYIFQLQSSRVYFTLFKCGVIMIWKLFLQKIWFFLRDTEHVKLGKQRGDVCFYIDDFRVLQDSIKYEVFKDSPVSCKEQEYKKLDEGYEIVFSPFGNLKMEQEYNEGDQSRNVEIISYIMRQSDGDRKKTLQIIR